MKKWKWHKIELLPCKWLDGSHPSQSIKTLWKNPIYYNGKSRVGKMFLKSHHCWWKNTLTERLVNISLVINFPNKEAYLSWAREQRNLTNLTISLLVKEHTDRKACEYWVMWLIFQRRKLICLGLGNREIWHLLKFQISINLLTLHK